MDSLTKETKRRSWVYGWQSYWIGWRHELTFSKPATAPTLTEQLHTRLEIAATVDFENDGAKGSFLRFCPTTEPEV